MTMRYCSSDNGRNLQMFGSIGRVKMMMREGLDCEWCNEGGITDTPPPLLPLSLPLTLSVMMLQQLVK
jgi:hypothetical protein